MALSPNVRRTFDAWINASTWYSGHPYDEERFFRFVWAACTFSRRPIAASKLMREIVNKWSGKLDDDFLTKHAHEYAALYETLYEFAKVRKKGMTMLIDPLEVPNPSFKRGV